jgi:endonuclease III related protein
MVEASVKTALMEIYNRLMAHYGPQHWWPAEEPFEVIVGAILTQSAAWANVEKAIANLKRAGSLSAAALRSLDVNELAVLIRPSGYYNAKALKLKAFAEWLAQNFSGDLDRMFGLKMDSLRKKLLSVHGIGEETADSILLYAGNKPVFVIDAYTRRVTGRLGIAPEHDSYAGYQAFFMENLPPDVKLFNEYHALLVRLGKDACRKRPLCERCCLGEMCEYHKCL